MAAISWEQYGQNIGNTTGDVIGGVADAAAGWICDIWENNPLQLTGAPLGTYAGALTGALADRLCKPRGIDPPPDSSIPLSGGQCVCRQYNVTYQLLVEGEPYATGNDIVQGPIGTPYKIRESGGGASWRYDYGAPNCGGRQAQGIFSSSDPADLDRFTVVGFTAIPTDGLPDGCGDAYPTFNQGPIVPYNPPALIPIPSPGGLAPINVAPVIIPVTIAPNINFSPEINVSLGPFNINVNPDGIDININPNFNFPSVPGVDNPSYPDAPPNVPRLPPRNPDNSGEDCCDVIEEINNKVDELLDCDRCKVPTQLLPISLGFAQSNVLIGIQGEPKYAEIIVENIPTNAKIQAGIVADDVLFAGWAWWSINGKNFERLPIDAEFKAFTAPEGANGFSYTLKTGFAGFATVFTEVEVEGG